VTWRASDLKPRPLEWLWKGWIPRGAITLLEGDPGEGKSQLSCLIAAHVTTGKAFPGETKDRYPANVLIMSAEDDPAVTIAPRLAAAGADLTRVTGWEGVWSDDGKDLRFPSFPEDAALLKAIIEEDAYDLIVIDPMMAYVGLDYDSNADQAMRVVLSQIHAVCRETRAAVLFLRHLNKAGGGKQMYRGGGSIGIIGQARSAIRIAAKEGLGHNVRLLEQVKNNLAEKGQNMLIEIVSKGGVPRVEWVGPTSVRLSGKAKAAQQVNVTVNNIVTATPKALTPRAYQRLKQNAEAVVEALKAGPKDGVSLTALRKETGLSWKQINEAVDGLAEKGRVSETVVPNNNGTEGKRLRLLE
jgi:hypothetical protein